MKGDWFRSDTARRLAESILSYQTPSGGWSKHVDFTRGPRPRGTSYFSENDGWNFIATIDNNATTDEIRFLARAYQVTGEARYRDAMVRGIEYLLAAQFPNGCWPQVFPLSGGYHDAATFNDDAIVNSLQVLRSVSASPDSTKRDDQMADVPAELRARSADAVQRGIECILAAQVVVDGRRTIWGQQSDPLTLAPVAARSYEHASLASRESAAVVALLMRLDAPDRRVVDAVHAATDWFKANVRYGVLYDVGRGIVERAGAGPVWARMSEVGTNRPIFSNRDGVVLYDYHKLTDRAVGYVWFSDEPAAVLSAYDRWSRRHPRAVTGD
jgi:PelA/Pel-15E family pectate lyase